MLKVLVLKSLEENFIILMCGHFCLLDPGVALFCLEDAEVTQRMESITSLFLFVFFYPASASCPQDEVAQCCVSPAELSWGGYAHVVGDADGGSYLS